MSSDRNVESLATDSTGAIYALNYNNHVIYQHDTGTLLARCGRECHLPGLGPRRQPVRPDGR